jgi:hypothetical protein
MIGTIHDDECFSSALEALMHAGKPYDLVVLPEQPHSLVNMGPAAYRYLQEAVRRYFQVHLSQNKMQPSLPRRR